MSLDEFKNFKDTTQIQVPLALIDQVIGQEAAVAILRQAAAQKRFVLLVGEPGTGKSMLGKAMAELLSSEALRDLLVLPNGQDKNMPRIESVPAGEAQKKVNQAGSKAQRKKTSLNFTFWTMIFGFLVLGGVWAFIKSNSMFFYGGGLAAFLLWSVRRQSLARVRGQVPKLLVGHQAGGRPPFIDATGSQAGALLGDVRHDPYQSGGVETSPHELIEAGAIHRANGGVLYIDEAGTLGMESQQNLLTAIQEKEFSITGRSPGSSGMMVRSNPVPCDFHLILAGNIPDLEKMHPALRSRIRGYGYEVYTQDSMEDTLENQKSLLRFVTQEIYRDGRIPHFDKDACLEVIKEARRQSGSRGRLTLKLRNLGGLVRAAGDLAKRENAPLALKRHVQEARDLVKPLELQMVEHQIFLESQHLGHEKEARVGRVNSFCLIKGLAGAPLSVACEATTVGAKEKREGRIRGSRVTRDRLESSLEIAATLLKKYSKKNLSNYDLSLQIQQDYPAMEIEKDSAAAVLAIFASVMKISVPGDLVVLGSVHVNGDLHPANNILPRVEAAVQSGIRRVIMPTENLEDVLLDESQKHGLEIIGANSLKEVLQLIKKTKNRKKKKRTPNRLD